MESDPLFLPLSPLPRVLTPTPHRPLFSTTETDYENIRLVCREYEEMTPDQETHQFGTFTSRGRGQFRTRGTRSRGGNTNKRQRVANTATGTSECQKGERVIEICLNDEDVPLKLKEMVYELEAARFLKSCEQIKQRNIIPNEEEFDSDDVYYDAEIIVANELFDGDSAALKFLWSPIDTIDDRREVFQPLHIGPSCKTSCTYEAFRKFWDDDILEHIVKETNRNAQDLKSSSELFEHEWYDTNCHEIMILFSFWIMLGIIRMPTTKSCYSTNPILKTGIFRILMTEKRYWFLNRALHFVDNAARTSKSSKLFSLGPITDHLNKKFMEAYVPGPDIVIRESLALWKGDLSLRPNNISKDVCFDLKTIELCESTTGYTWSFLSYAYNDRRASSSKLPKSIDVVIQLIRPLLNKGYRLFVDKLSISPILARFLKRNRTDCVGKLHEARRNLPAIIGQATITEGSCVARDSGDVVVMAYQDKNPKYTISTCHGTESNRCDGNDNSLSHYKPAVITDYNKVMAARQRYKRRIKCWNRFYFAT